MSTEEVEKMARQRAESRYWDVKSVGQDVIDANIKAGVEDYLAGFIAGQRSPNREMLIELLSFAEDYDREQAREGNRPTYTEIVNEFLKSEQQL